MKKTEDTINIYDFFVKKYGKRKKTIE